MPRRDSFHDAVRTALERDGQTITDDPLVVPVGQHNLFVDLGAERLLAAERGTERIAVEVVPLNEYPIIVRRVIEEYASFKPSYGDIEVETVFDEARGHYELLYSGWIEYKRIHGPVIHVDIKGDKIWIQHDGTERGIATDLLEHGIPADKIVLAFQHATQRRHGEFAVA